MFGFTTNQQNILGIDFLDQKLNVNRPIMILMEQDPSNLNHKVFEKLYAAQSAENIKKSEYSLNLFIRAKNLFIPKRTSFVSDKGNKQMKIAWRYNTTAQNIEYGFDMLENVESQQNIEFGQNNTVMDYTLLTDLGTPHDPVTNKSLFELRREVIRKNTILFATSPTHLYKDTNIHFNLYFDIVISLESGQAAENGYHGLLRIKKFINQPDTLIFGYRINRYGIEMESFEMAPTIEAKRIGNELAF